MRQVDLVTALVLLGLGAIVLMDALRLGIGWGTDGPKSGFFPFWLAVVLMVACGLIAAQALRLGRGRPFVARAQAEPVLKVLLPAAGLVVATAFVGLYVAAAVYMAVY